MYFNLDDITVKYYPNATKISLILIQMTSTKYVLQYINNNLSNISLNNYLQVSLASPFVFPTLWQKYMIWGMTILTKH